MYLRMGAAVKENVLVGWWVPDLIPDPGPTLTQDQPSTLCSVGPGRLRGLCPQTGRAWGWGGLARKGYR